MMMRPQKSQINPNIKVLGGASRSWNRVLPMLAGYTNFNVIMVGASGGYGGKSTYNTENTGWGGGGGGGGMLRVQGPLKGLPQDTIDISAGLVGGNGTDAGKNTKGGTGATGGTSSFGSWSATGGRGGEGGDVEYAAQLGGSGIVASGGDGGTNSKDLGEPPGQGGIGETAHSAPNYTLPTRGSVGSVNESPLYFYGGTGGGGGTGRIRTNNQVNAEAKPGKEGMWAAGYTCPGGPITSSRGGTGGGSDISDVTGSEDPEYYGAPVQVGEPDGVVFLKLS
jgi:hypothetical protein